VKIVDLHHKPECIRPLASWHHRQWHTLRPGEEPATFANELARAPDADGLPRSWIALQDTPGNLAGNGMRADDTPPPAAAGDGCLLLGSISLLEDDRDTLPALSPWVANLWVHPHWRGRGVGTALLKHCLAAAATLQFPRLFLYTAEHGDFYRRHGWRRHERLSLHRQQVEILRFDCR